MYNEYVMKKTTIFVALLAIILPLSTYAVSDKALESGSGVWGNVKYEGENINEEGEIESRFEVKSSTSTEALDKGQNDDNSGLGEEHRSEVANFVRGLLLVADRNGGLGEEIRNIAREQASSSEDVAEAVERVEERSKLKIFLIGTDYKNLGEIRSELVKTESRVEKLKREMERLIPYEQKEIEAEIVKIESEREELLKFIEDNESQFSLFGWLVKLF